MSLVDIIAAIHSQTDKELALHQERLLREKNAIQMEHEQNAQKLRSAHEEKMSAKRMQKIKEVESRAGMQRRLLLLTKRRALLEDTYAEVLNELKALPESDQKKLLNPLLSSVRTSGVIHPAESAVSIIKDLPAFDSKKFSLGSPIQSAGGFIVSGDTLEENMTYEHLVREILRAQTESKITSELFAS